MYMVVFTTAEGKPGYHQAESLEDAIKFVERMCNSEGVSDAKIYRLTEIPLEVKSVYRVEVAGAPALASPDGAEAPAGSVVRAVPTT